MYVENEEKETTLYREAEKYNMVVRGGGGEKETREQWTI